MKSRAPKFVGEERGLDLAELGIKLWACPHCGRIGTLIGHGFLRGYAERGQEQVVRGRRFFCSNRYRRPGCGRTLSVLVATVISRFVVRALTLFRFAREVVLGVTLGVAWRTAREGAFSVSSGYRLWRRLRAAQSTLRSRLCREEAPPACMHSEPVAALLEHFGVVFPGSVCPFSEFQLRLQHGLFARAA